MDKKELTIILTKIFRYYGTEINESNLEIYVEFLENYDIKYIKKAYNYFIMESKFMPKISEFREYMNMLKRNDTEHLITHKNVVILDNDNWIKLSDVIKK